MDKIFEQVFCAQDENLYKIIEFVTQLAENVGFSMKKIMQLELATEEVVVNIIRYAYNGQTGNILVRILDEATALQLVFIDDGLAFDPTRAEDPDINAALEDREIGGLGIYLVHKLMDHVNYTRENNQNILRLTMNKELHSNAES